MPTLGLNLTRHQLDTFHIHPDSISRTPHPYKGRAPSQNENCCAFVDNVAASAHSRAAAVQFDARATAGRVFAVYNAVLANKAGLADMSAFDELFEVVDPGLVPEDARETTAHP